MNYDSNSPDEIRKRRAQGLLKICGDGVILFAFWNIVKFLLQILVTDQSLLAGFTNQTAITIGIIFIIVFMLVDTGLRILVWLSAVKEGKGGKPRNFYIVVTFFLLFFDLAMLTFISLSDFADGITLTVIVETVLNATSEFVLIGVIIEAIRLRVINKKVRTEG